MRLEKILLGPALILQVIEGWFYLWRVTRKNKYRQWSWMAAKAIDKYCRISGGYSFLLFFILLEILFSGDPPSASRRVVGVLSVFAVLKIGGGRDDAALHAVG